MGKAHWVTPGTALRKWWCLAISQVEAGDAKYVMFSRTHKKTYMDDFSRGYIDHRKFWRYKQIYIYMEYYRSIIHEWCLALLFLRCFMFCLLLAAASKKQFV